MKKKTQTEFQRALEHLKKGDFLSCCMKKHLKEPEVDPVTKHEVPYKFGVVFADEVTTINLRSVKTGTCTGETVQYKTIEDMLNDGWLVD